MFQSSLSMLWLIVGAIKRRIAKCTHTVDHSNGFLKGCVSTDVEWYQLVREAKDHVLLLRSCWKKRVDKIRINTLFATALRLTAYPPSLTSHQPAPHMYTYNTQHTHTPCVPPTWDHCHCSGGHACSHHPGTHDWTAHGTTHVHCQQKSFPSWLNKLGKEKGQAFKPSERKKEKQDERGEKVSKQSKKLSPKVTTKVGKCVQLF